MSLNTTLASGTTIDTITLTDTITINQSTTACDQNYYSNYPTITVAPNTNPYYGTGILTTGIDSITFPDDLNGTTLKVRGDADIDGDLTIKGVSLNDRLDKIEERLGILRVNDALEEKWENLRELANQYRALEKEIIEKENMWDILKK
jgi:predicted metal-dependent phosphoesterase TrpH